jgi:hypothetical protein
MLSSHCYGFCTIHKRQYAFDFISSFRKKFYRTEPHFFQFFFAAINQLLATLSNRSPGVAIDFTLTKKCDTYKFSGIIPDADVTFIPADLPCGASFGLPTMPSLVNNFASVSCMNDGTAIVSACPAVGSETKAPSSPITLNEALICNSPLGSGLQFASFGIYRSQCRGLYILDNSSTANCSLPSSKKPKNPTFLRARDKSQVSRCPPGVNVGSLPWAMTCSYYGMPTVHFCNGNWVQLTPSDKCDIAPRDTYLNIGGFSYNSICGPPGSSLLPICFDQFNSKIHFCFLRVCQYQLMQIRILLCSRTPPRILTAPVHWLSTHHSHLRTRSAIPLRS